MSVFRPGLRWAPPEFINIHILMYINYTFSYAYADSRRGIFLRKCRCVQHLEHNEYLIIKKKYKHKKENHKKKLKNNVCSFIRFAVCKRDQIRFWKLSLGNWTTKVDKHNTQLNVKSKYGMHRKKFRFVHAASTFILFEEIVKEFRL